MKAHTAHHTTISKLRDKDLGQQKQLYSEGQQMRRWQSSVLKNHLEKVQNSDFFYVRGRENLEGFEVRKELMTTDIWTPAQVQGGW